MKTAKQSFILWMVLLSMAVSAQEGLSGVQGMVLDRATGLGIGLSTLELTDEQGRVQARGTADSNGSYRLEVALDKTFYRLLATAQDYNAAQVSVSPYGSQELHVDFKLDRQEEDRAALPVIYFDFNSSYLTATAKEQLRELASYLQAHPRLRLQVDGHTDARGSNAYNDWLSERRAGRIIDWLVTREGIASDRLESAAYGKRQLENECADGVPCGAEKHSRNRRGVLEYID